VLEDLAIIGAGKPYRHPGGSQVALLPEVDAYDTHRARTRVARGVNRAGSVVGVDEPLDFCLVLAAPGRRTILDRAGRQDCDKDEEQGDPGPAGQCGAGNGA